MVSRRQVKAPAVDVLQEAAEGREDIALLLRSQEKAAAELARSQKKAAAVLRRSQQKAAACLRDRQLEDVKSLPPELRDQLIAAFDAQAAGLRELQDEAADMLLSSQRTAAALLLDATQRVRTQWEARGRK